MNNKPTYLCLYGYHRANWIAPILAIQNQVNLVFLFHIYQEFEILNSSSVNAIYWSDYSSAQDLLAKINPQKIIFMSIDSPLTIVLNSTAQYIGIKTIFLQHGLLHSVKMYDDVQKRGKPISTSDHNRPVHKFILKFFLKSIRYYNISLLFFQFKLSVLERKYTKVLARSKVYSKMALANEYIVYTKKNANVLVERDGVSFNNMTAIGIPEFDTFFNQLKEEKTAINTKGYLLLIDYPMAEIKEYNNTGAGFSKKTVNKYYMALANFAKNNGLKLKIKLHPYSYTSSFMVDNPAIEYIREANTDELILNARAVIGGASTLILPVICSCPLILVELFNHSGFLSKLKQMNICESFTVQEIIDGKLNANLLNNNNIDLSIFIEEFIFKTDGQSTTRCAKALLSE